jgi:hypothetical protein
MKMHYLYFLPFVWGLVANSNGIDDGQKTTNSQKPTGHAALMSSAISQDEDEKADLQTTPAVPPVPVYKSSSPREILSPKATSPKGRVLKQRHVHPSGDYTSAAPKQNVPDSSTPTPAPTDNQKPLNS